jgi:hypothetical protein
MVLVIATASVAAAAADGDTGKRSADSLRGSLSPQTHLAASDQAVSRIGSLSMQSHAYGVKHLERKTGPGEGGLKFHGSCCCV